jgi:acetyl esterase/lipase
MKLRKIALAVAAAAIVLGHAQVTTHDTAEASMARRAQPTRVLKSSSTEIRADFAYGTHPSQMLTATYDPDVSPSTDRFVVVVHGGSWAPWNNPGRQLMGTATARFRAEGFAVFSVDSSGSRRTPLSSASARRVGSATASASALSWWP